MFPQYWTLPYSGNYSIPRDRPLFRSFTVFRRQPIEWCSYITSNFTDVQYELSAAVVVIPILRFLNDQHSRVEKGGGELTGKKLTSISQMDLIKTTRIKY